MDTAPQGKDNSTYDPKAIQGTAGSLDPTLGVAPGAPSTAPPTTATGITTPTTAPNNAQINPPNAPVGVGGADVPYAQAQANLATGGLTGTALTAAQGVLANKYKQALPGLQQSGQAPDNAGAARSAVTSAVAQYSQPDTSVADAYADPVTSEIFKAVHEILNPAKQSTTLMQDYEQLRKDSGLDKINAELIDAETVINGTEDDIRNEIQSSGGFGTESQIQAMSLSRNKSLLARYNQLAQMKTDATNQLSTMSQLNASDKQLAQTKTNQQLDVLFKMADFTQKAQNNIKEQSRWLTETMGADGLYNAYKTDPRQLGFLEKSLGLAPGGLAIVAQQAAQEKAMEQQKDLLQLDVLRSNLKTDAMQRENLASQINERNNPAPKPQTQPQVVAQGYADRAAAASKIISDFKNKFASPLALGGTTILGFGVPNSLKSPERKQNEQAERDFVNAVLRPESGAAISESEFDSASKQYFPRAGDDAGTITQKERNRQVKIQNLYAQARTNQPTSEGDVIEYNGQNYSVDAQGNMTPL